MPIVVITAPPLPAAADALVDVSTSVAAALGLQPGDVIASLVPVAVTVRGVQRILAWPVVTVHGSTRPAAAAALTAARTSVAASWSCPPEDIWTEWIDAATPAT